LLFAGYLEVSSLTPGLVITLKQDGHWSRSAIGTVLDTGLRNGLEIELRMGYSQSLRLPSDLS